MKQIICTFLFLLLLTCPAQAQDVIFEDNFESYDSGTVPGAPWVTRFSGESAAISEEIAAEGSKSFQLVSNSSWARVEAVPMDSIYDYMLYSGWVYVDQADRGGVIGFGFTESGNTYRTRNSVRFDNTGQIRFVGNIVQTYEAQTWYKVMVYCDFVRHIGKVWIDDQLKMDKVTLSTRAELEDFCIFGDNFSGTGTSTLYFDDVHVYKLEYKIKSIVDVPNDQGRQIRLSWFMHPYDNISGEGIAEITKYSVWRQVDSNLVLHKANMAADWDFIKSVPAVQDPLYHTIVPTLADSNHHGMYRTTYMIRAHSSNVLDHWQTDADSGYSVDNLAPAQVNGVDGKNIDNQHFQLSWDENMEKDFSHYNVYRGASAGFTPEAVLATTAVPGFLDEDVQSLTYYYRISAVDFNGNEGPFSDEVSVQVTALGESESITTEFALNQNYPNPFNPITTINYQLPLSRYVDLSVYNLMGQKLFTLVAETQPAGDYKVQWDASGYSSSVYYYILHAGEFKQIRKMVLLR